jgi:hypothetical protein
MKYSRSGKNTFPVSIGGVNARGFWLLLGDRRVFVAYRAFPWFREFTARELAGVRRLAPNHLRWAEFDIDLEVESIERPDAFPLVEKRLQGQPARVVEELRTASKSAKRVRASEGQP